MTSDIPLGDITTINPKIPDKVLAKPNNLASFLPMSAVGVDGHYTSEEIRPISKLKNGYTYFEPGDVLLAKITPCMENGKAALIDKNLPQGVGFGSTDRKSVV